MASTFAAAERRDGWTLTRVKRFTWFSTVPTAGHPCASRTTHTATRTGPALTIGNAPAIIGNE